jgi:hypothetical protein
VKAVGDDNAFPGEFDVILSTTNIDRDSEQFAPYALMPLPDHMSFDIDHGMSVATTVGSGVPKYEKAGTELRVRGTWASTDLAQNTRTLVREGHIRGTSVAFMGAKYENVDGVPTIVKAEILNGAFTPIPSNRESVVLSAKALAGDPDSVLAYVNDVLDDARNVLALDGPVTTRSVRALLADANRVLAGPARRQADAMLRSTLNPTAGEQLVADLLSDDHSQKGSSNGRKFF